MTTATLSPPATRGIPQHAEAEGAIAASSRETLDAALADLAARKDDWARLAVADRRAIVRELIKDFSAVADRWAEACRQAEGIPAESPTASEE